MDVDPELVAALERRLVNAWPAFEVEVAEGWMLRFAEGLSKRANSATALCAGARLDAGLVAHVAAAFAARGLPPCFRLTGLEAPDTAQVLTRAGFRAFDPSLVLVGATHGPARDGAVRIDASPRPRWIEAAAAGYGTGSANEARFARIVGLIRQPAAFATLEIDGAPAAWGMAVAERGHVGLYDLLVAPDRRGRGLGRRLVIALLAWGREAGATRAYLQVRETNEVAARLYAGLGFLRAYRYSNYGPADLVRRDPSRTVATSAPAAMSPQASASERVGSA